MLSSCQERSIEVVWKWWRRVRDQGLAGLEERKPQGTLCRFDKRVAEAALQLKRIHRGWGVQRVLVELRQTPALQGLKLPSASRWAVYFKERLERKVNANGVVSLGGGTYSVGR